MGWNVRWTLKFELICIECNNQDQTPICTNPYQTFKTINTLKKSLILTTMPEAKLEGDVQRRDANTTSTNHIKC